MVDKRRRKRARTQAESSSEDESSASDHHSDSASELSELSDDEVPSSTPQPVTTTDEHPRERLRKTPLTSQNDFSQAYMKLVTEQFGEELAAMREANDFNSASIAQLVAGLKQGADIFSEEQRRLL